MNQHSAHGHPADHDDHGGLAKYIYVFLMLCLLTTASFWTFSDWPIRWPFHHLPAVGWSFMMAVSCAKAMLVILFFMHVKYEASWKYVLTVPPGIMAVFLVLALIPDIGLRNFKTLGGKDVASERLMRMAEPQDQFRPNTPTTLEAEEEAAAAHHE
jgi:cytochrome c oxidase subunit 4